MRRWMMMVASLLISSVATMYAKDKVTVEATSEDISDGLDLKAVANLFGEVKDLAEFEEKLNSEKLHLCNLDLNGDGRVDYLRVVEVEEGGDRHLVLIQAVLAKDIYQDIASIYVEHKSDNSVAVQVIGDTYIYGKNYIIEPVYIYRPVIYDWFWGPGWVCYTSPWYWGYWPGWYAPYPCWGYHTYVTHIHVYHYDHPRCAYRYGREPHAQASSMRNYSGRSDYASANASRSFSSRTGMSSAREMTSARVARGTSSSEMASRSTTYNSMNTGATRTSYSSGATASRGSSTYSGAVSSGYNGGRSNSYSTSRGNSYSTSRGSSSYSGASGGYSGGSARGSSSYSGSSSSYSGSRGSSSYSGASGGGYSGGSARGSSSYSGAGGSYSGGSRR